MTRHDHHGGRSAQRRALWIALIANGGFMVVEVVGGLAFGSLALLADAAHMASDVAGLAVALVAQRLVERPASARHTFGLERAEVLGALGNAVLLLGTAAYVFVEAAGRLSQPVEVEGAGLLAVATLGLLVNVGSAVLLARTGGRSLNVRAATTHLAADALGSVGAILAGVAVVTIGATWVDPLVSVLIGVLVLVAAWRLLRDTLHVLLEGAPAHLDPSAVEEALLAGLDVRSVHHLHLWNIASDTPALSAHVVLTGGMGLHDAQRRADALKADLERRFGIAHSTLELECHRCEEPVAHGAPGERDRPAAPV